MAEDKEARRQGEHQRLYVFERLVTGAANVGGRKEAKDILGRLGELPKLPACQPARRKHTGRRARTEVQYVSSAGMCRSSDSRKMPCLKTILESLAPMAEAVQDSRPAGREAADGGTDEWADGVGVVWVAGSMGSADGRTGGRAGCEFTMAPWFAPARGEVGWLAGRPVSTWRLGCDGACTSWPCSYEHMPPRTTSQYLGASSSLAGRQVARGLGQHSSIPRATGARAAASRRREVLLWYRARAPGKRGVSPTVPGSRCLVPRARRPCGGLIRYPYGQRALCVLLQHRACCRIRAHSPGGR